MGNQDVKNVVIVGAGPAGYTAAIYAARASAEPVLIEGTAPGGQLMITTKKIAWVPNKSTKKSFIPVNTMTGT